MNARLALVLLLPTLAQAQSPVTFDQQDTSLQIKINAKPVATYVWQDREVLRPYFAHLHAPSGVSTRNTSFWRIAATPSWR